MSNTPAGGSKPRKPRNKARRADALNAQKHHPELGYHEALAATARKATTATEGAFWPPRMEFHPDRFVRAAEALLRASEHLEALADRGVDPELLRLGAHQAAYLSSACIETIQDIRQMDEANDALLAHPDTLQPQSLPDAPRPRIIRKQFPGALPDDPSGPDMSDVVHLLRIALEEVWRPNLGLIAIGAATGIAQLAAWAERGSGAVVLKHALAHRGGPALVADAYAAASIPIPGPETGCNPLIDVSRAQLGDVVRFPSGAEGVVFGTGQMLVGGGEVLPIGVGAQVYPVSARQS